MFNAKAKTVRRIGSLVPNEIAYPLVLKRMQRNSNYPASGCWESTLYGNGSGYKQVSFRGKRVQQHRLSYEIHKGPIPEGLYVLHTCDNRACWNPDHLWLGTISDNKQDELKKGRNYEANRTHCPRGHAYAEHGTVWDCQPGWRRCRVCARAKHRLAAGWSEEEAYSLEVIAPGVRTKRRTFGKSTGNS